MQNNNIAIDGPAGAGKSTVAKIIARKLNLLYIDTGAMYRSITWKALKNNIDIENEDQLEQLTKATHIELRKNTDNSLTVYCDGTDVTKEIREPFVSNNVSKVAQYKKVRDILASFQKSIAKSGNVIMDGRDIGSKVLPDAAFKFFLTASLEVRAQRRFLELQNNGIDCNLNDLIAEIQKRDEKDSTRKYSPLIKAADAIEIDTDKLNSEEVADLIIKIVTKKISKSNN